MAQGTDRACLDVITTPPTNRARELPYKLQAPENATTSHVYVLLSSHAVLLLVFSGNATTVSINSPDLERYAWRGGGQSGAAVRRRDHGVRREGGDYDDRGTESRVWVGFWRDAAVSVVVG